MFRVGSGFFLGCLFCHLLAWNIPWVWLPLLCIGCFWKKTSFVAAFLAALVWAQSGIAAITETAWFSSPPKEAIVEGVVASIPHLSDDHYRFVFRVKRVLTDAQWRPVKAALQLRWYRPSTKIDAMSQWRLRVRLKKRREIRVPGVNSPWRQRLSLRLTASGYVLEDTLNHKIKDNIFSLNYVRQRLSERIRARLGDHPYLGQVLALSIGDKQAIDPVQWRVLTRTGTNHLLAISGLHIGFVAGMAMWMAQWLWRRVPALVRLTPAVKAGALVSLLAALVYAALAGFTLPTQRALIMLSVALWALFAGRQYRHRDVFALALLFVLLWDPLSILSIGFYLSFGAVAIILYLTSGRRQTWRRLLRIHLAVSICLFPWLIYFFHAIALISPLANLVAIPWVSLAVVPPLLLGLMLDTLTGWDFGLISLAGVTISLLNGGLQWMAQIPWQYQVFGEWRLWLLPCLFVAVLLVFAPRGFPLRGLGMLVALLIVISPRSTPMLPHDLHATTRIEVLDTGGNGLMVMVLAGGNHLLYVDLPVVEKTQRWLANSVIKPYLRYNHVRRLHAVVLANKRNILFNKYLTDDIKVESSIGEGQLLRCVQWRRQWGQVQLAFSPQSETGCVLKLNHGGHRLLIGDVAGLETGTEFTRQVEVVIGSRLKAVKQSAWLRTKNVIIAGPIATGKDRPTLRSVYEQGSFRVELDGDSGFVIRRLFAGG